MLHFDFFQSSFSYLQIISFDTMVLFLCFTAYQPTWVILCQSHLCTRIEIMLINKQLRDKEIQAFPKDIGPKGNLIPRLEFEPAYKDVTVRYVSHYAMCTFPVLIQGERMR